MAAGLRALAPPEVVLEHSDPHAPRITHVRGILIAGSRPALQTLGVYERYVANLPPEHKDALLYCIANSWIPLDETMAHFDACDRIGLTAHQYAEIGRALSDRLAKTFLNAALRAVRSAGAEGQMWWSLSHMDRFLGRVYQGGRFKVCKLGPKEASIEFAGIPFANSAYYRGVLSAETKAMLNLFCRSIYVKFLPARIPGAESFTLSLSWV